MNCAGLFVLLFNSSPGIGEMMIMNICVKLFLDRAQFLDGINDNVILARVFAQDSPTVDTLVVNTLMADYNPLESIHLAQLIDREDAALLGDVFEHAGLVFSLRRCLRKSR